ncbi:MAG: MBL fold metallo-hydrolase [Proteobacteria bacterium]|nr:MBL fold metallo-hydrolase [Pseudomonadota bacterium]
MNIKEKQLFGEVEAYKFGFGPVGPPLMSVYLYYLDGLVIDTAQSRMHKDVITALQTNRIEKILLTHYHEDHSGNASALSNFFNVNVYGHDITANKMGRGFKIRFYQLYTWGKSGITSLSPLPPLIETERYKLMPIHTPGHSKDHTVYLEENNGWLFSGDLYLGERIKYFRSDEKFKDQIDSIKMILEYDFDALFCAHNPVPEKGKIRLAKKLSFLQEIYGEVQRLYLKGYSEAAIVKAMGNGKDKLVKFVTLGNASFAQMVRSAMES